MDQGIHDGKDRVTSVSDDRPGISRGSHIPLKGVPRRGPLGGMANLSNPHEADSIATHSSDFHIYNVPIFDPIATSKAHTLELASMIPQDPHRGVGIPSSVLANARATRRHIQNSGAYQAPTYLDQLGDTVGILGETPPDVSGLFDWRDSYITPTVTNVPSTPKLQQTLKIPLGIIVRPYLYLHDNNNPPPLIEDGLIFRCHRCRSYLNPYVKIHADANAWRCNICKFANEVPVITGDAIRTPLADILTSRIETKNYVFDYLVPDGGPFRQEFVPIYIFVIDVSYNSVQTGLLSSTMNALSESLELIPNNEGNVKVSVICVDDKLHFFKLSELRTKEVRTKKYGFTMLDVADLNEPWLPQTPQEFLIPLKGNETAFRSLFRKISLIFASNSVADFTLLPALNIVKSIFDGIGGKLTIFSASEPSNKGHEPSPNVDNNQMAATSCESYKELALEYNKLQISTDFVLVLDNYVNVEALTCLSEWTGGQTYAFRSVNLDKGQATRSRFSIEVAKKLSSDLSFRSSMRIRTSAGLKIDAAYGNFFEGANGVYSFPVLPRDQEYTFEISVDKELHLNKVYFQVACLMTLSSGKRVIRIINLGLESTKSVEAVYSSVDQKALLVLLARRSVQLATSKSLSEAQKSLKLGLMDTLKSYKDQVLRKRNKWNGHAAQLYLPSNMALLPFLVYSLLKSDAFSESLVSIGMRALALNFLRSNPGKYIVKHICPAVYGVSKDTSSTECCDVHVLTDAELSKLNPSKVYIIDNSYELYLWIGSGCEKRLSGGLSREEDPTERLYETDNVSRLVNPTFGTLVKNLIDEIRDKRNSDSVTYQTLWVLHGNDGPLAGELGETAPLQGKLLAMAINSAAYKSFLQHLVKDCMQ